MRMATLAAALALTAVVPADAGSCGLCEPAHPDTYGERFYAPGPGGIAGVGVASGASLVVGTPTDVAGGAPVAAYGDAYVRPLPSNVRYGYAWAPRAYLNTTYQGFADPALVASGVYGY